MAATTLDRLTQHRYLERQIVGPLKSGETIPYGVIVMTDTPSTGFRNAADVAGGVVVGWCGQRAATSDGDVKCLVNRGIAKFANGGNVTAAHIGILMCVVDNQTVNLAANTTNAIGVGYLDSIDDDGGLFVSMLGGKIAAT